MGFGNANRTDGLLSKKEYKEFRSSGVQGVQGFKNGSQEDSATQCLEGSQTRMAQPPYWLLDSDSSP